MSHHTTSKKATTKSLLAQALSQSKIKKVNWRALRKVEKKFTFDQPREDTVFSIKSTMTLLMKENPIRSQDEPLGEEFTRLKLKYPDWLDIAKDLTIILFPSSSDEERKKIIQDKLIAPFMIAKAG